MRRISTALIALAVLLALPAVAAGQATLPPDNAAIDEYVEGLPSPTGKKPSRGATGDGAGGGSGGGSGAGGALPGGAVTALEALGADGRAVAELAAATAPRLGGSAPGSQGRDGSGGSGGPNGAGAAGNGAGDGERTSEVRGVIGQGLSGGAGGGMGALLPLILVLTLLGAIGVAVLRRRQRGAGPSG